MQVLQEIREKFHLACGDGAYAASAVAEEGLAAVAGGEDDTQDQDEDDDPMNALDDVVETLAKPKAKAKAKINKGTLRASVHELEMPMTPPCAGCGKSKIICVYRKPGSVVRNKENLYLRADCIGWLLSCLYKQCARREQR